jgi:hypothetical protein
MISFSQSLFAEPKTFNAARECWLFVFFDVLEVRQMFFLYRFQGFSLHHRSMNPPLLFSCGIAPKKEEASPFRGKEKR